MTRWSRSSSTLLVFVASGATTFVSLSNAGTAQSGIVGSGYVAFDTRFTDEEFVEIAANGSHTLARRADGSVAAWGSNGDNQCTARQLPAGLWYVEVAAGGFPSSYSFPDAGHSLARRNDGSVVAWGRNSHGQCDVPVLPAGLAFVQISAGNRHSLARLSDGSVVAWGDTTWRVAATDRSWRGARILSASATCPRSGTA
jgi:alpha-tubulin suppressor-like RCC1 family protein